MTQEMTAAALAVPGTPTPNTLVLVDRKLNPQRLPEQMSVFTDDWWDVSAGLFEAHVPTCRLNFHAVPERFRDAAKHYIWQVINRDDPNERRSTRGRRLALRSIVLAQPRLAVFLHWLDTRDITRLADVTTADLDQYAADVSALEATATYRGALLVEVRRLWSYRSLLPEPLRLPPAPPSGGDQPSDLLGGAKRGRENRTPRIAAETMETLLMWCLRFVENFADDIIDAYHEYLLLWGRSADARNKKLGYAGNLGTPAQAEAPLRAWLTGLRQAGEGLPSKAGPDGERQVDWPHVCRIFDVGFATFYPGRRLRGIVDEFALPLGGDAMLDTPVRGKLHGRPWRGSRIRYAEAPELARMLCTASMVVIAYLTGMRTGEVLNLERGCVNHNPVTGLWFITGKHWKSVRDRNGDKIPEGEQRLDPWTTVRQVADAVAALERLHPHQLLFTAQLHPVRTSGSRSTRPAQGRTARELPRDTTALIEWINAYCDANGLADQRVPPDPHGQVAASRFRRTLAWHIVRRPRGLVAGAIQYGHLHVQMTLGYAGTYDSGFPDEHAYEDWLFRLDTLADNHRLLTNGEHISGPAAGNYRHRIQAAHHKFAGRVLPNFNQARDLVTNPLLQIYPGRAMTCVFDPAKALCQMRTEENDVRRTPDQDDCRPTCQNIAFTDRNIADLRDRAAQLREITSDHLAPSLRHKRDQAELDRIRAIIHSHDHGK